MMTMSADTLEDNELLYVAVSICQLTDMTPPPPPGSCLMRAAAPRANGFT